MPSINDALKLVRQFLIDLENSPLRLVPNEKLFVLRPDNTPIFFEAAAQRTYSKCLEALTNAAKADKRGAVISRAAIEATFQKAITAAISDNDRQTSSQFTERLNLVLDRLKSSLTASPRHWHCYYRVGGLSEHGLPRKVGQVQFKFLDEFSVLELKRQFENKLSAEEHELMMSLFENSFSAPLQGKVVAVVECDAVDSAAAKVLAWRELRLTVDLVNFYSDLMTHPSQRSIIYLPGDADPSIEAYFGLAMSDELGFYSSILSVGPLVPLSFLSFPGNELNDGLGFNRVSSLLAKRQRTTLESRLLAAIQWAGRATVDARPEEAFLLFAIALESLLLTKEHPELSYRLKLRVARILGRDPDERVRIAKEVGEVYKVRSRIVHEGLYEISDADLRLVRFYAKSCILKVLTEEPLRSLVTIDEFETFLDRQVLT